MANKFYPYLDEVSVDSFLLTHAYNLPEMSFSYCTWHWYCINAAAPTEVMVDALHAQHEVPTGVAGCWGHLECDHGAQPSSAAPARRALLSLRQKYKSTSPRGRNSGNLSARRQWNVWWKKKRAMLDFSVTMSNRCLWLWMRFSCLARRGCWQTRAQQLKKPHLCKVL